MSQPQPQPQPSPSNDDSVTVLCEECGSLIAVRDPASLIRALHLLNECAVRTLVTPSG